jgi:hypothetical protein
MKYLKTFEKFDVNEDVNGLRDYSDKFPMNFKTQNISPSDRRDPDIQKKEVDFQQIQTEMQKILLPYLKEHEPNADQNDAVQASDRFCKQIGEKGQKIKDIVDSCKGNYVEAAKEIINQFKKEIINNYYRSDSNPVEQGGSDMSRESNSSEYSNDNRKGLLVFGKTEHDNNQIRDLIDNSDYYAEFDNEFQCWFFPEEPDLYNDLERELDGEFSKNGIDARFEGI